MTDKEKFEVIKHNVKNLRKLFNEKKYYSIHEQEVLCYCEKLIVLIEKNINWEDK